MNKKKNLVKIFGFLCGLAMILTAASVIIRPKDNDVYNLPSYVRTLENLNGEKENTVDVLFAGDSEASDGFSPLQFWSEQGISSFNIANPAQILPDTYALTAQAVKNQDVKLLVLEASCLYLDSDIYSKDPYLRAAEKLFPIVHYHQAYRLLKPRSVSFGKVRKTDALKGFWLKTNVREWVGDPDYMGDPAEPAQPFGYMAGDMMEKLYALCQENGIELLIVSVPAPAYWEYSKHNAVNAWAEEHGVTYIDMNQMNEELGMDWTQDSADGGNHLSFSGTVKVNAWLGQYIKDTYAPADHRGDAQYDSWKDALEETGLYGVNS